MIFVDESIQHNLGYICVGFVYCDSSPDEQIRSALRKVNFTPETDEYKSGGRMIASPERQQLRHEVSQIVLGNCKLGVYIAPVSERSTLLCGIVTAVREMIVANDLPLPQQVFIDQGIHGKPEDVDKDRVTLIPSCDSRTVLGIQLADYAAYHCSYLLKCALEGTSKSVRIGSVPHQLSDEEVHLDWMIRTEIRRNFFIEYRDLETIKGDDWFFKVAGFGSFFSRGLDAELQLHATDVFNQMYFGCVW